MIANVVSLASAPAAQPTANSNNVLQGRVSVNAPLDACVFFPSVRPRFLLASWAADGHFTSQES